MALKQYLFISNAQDGNGTAFRDRFAASDNPANDAFLPTAEAPNQAARDARAAARSRASAVDFLAPSQWVAVDVGTDPTTIPASSITRRVSAFVEALPSHTDQFVHFADVAAARAALAAASYNTDVEYRAMSYNDACAALGEAWRNLGNYFKFLNLPPITLQAYRRAWERRAQVYRRPFTWTPAGAAEGEISIAWQYVVGAPNTSHGQQAMPQMESVTLTTFVQGAAQWRLPIASAGAGINPDVSAGGIDQVQFCAIGLPGSAPTTPGVTPADSHRYWLTPQGDLVVTPATVAQIQSAFSVQPSAGSASMADPTWSQWFVGAESGGASGGASYLVGLPSLAEYYGLLREITQYLLARHPLAVVQEARLDLLGRNLWFVAATGHDALDLTTLNQAQAIKDDLSRRTDAQRTNDGIVRLFSLATSLIPGGGLAAGIFKATFGSAVGLATALTDQQPYVWRDMFGRVLPGFDVLSIQDAQDAAGVVTAGYPSLPVGDWPVDDGPTPGEPGAWGGTIQEAGNPAPGALASYGVSSPLFQPHRSEPSWRVRPALNPRALRAVIRQTPTPSQVLLQSNVPGATVSIAGINGGQFLPVPFGPTGAPARDLYTVTFRAPNHLDYTATVQIPASGMATLAVDESQWPSTIPPASSGPLILGITAVFAAGYVLWRRLR